MIEQRVRKFIDEQVGADAPDAFSNDADIFKLGLASSLFAMQLVSFVESEFAIDVANEDLTVENFCSVSNIVRFIERKRQASFGNPAPR